MNAVIGAVYAIADVIKGMMVKYCDEEVLRKYNETSCYINITSHTAEVRMFYSPLLYLFNFIFQATIIMVAYKLKESRSLL